MEMEKEDPETGERYTWIQGESLRELLRTERIEQIEQEFKKRIDIDKIAPNTPLKKILFSQSDSTEVGDNESCLICHL